MQAMTYDIQELVKVSGVPRRTIYFYVQQGLLPPPEGAGLAAHYSTQHLLRLKLIPIFRRQGLRLDDIRHKFAAMTPDEMQQMVAAGVPASLPAAPAPRVRKPPERLDRLTPPAKVSEEQATLGTTWPAEQHFVHYQLPGGVRLVAPVGLSQPETERLLRLLQAAAVIYDQPVSRQTPGENGSAQPDERSQEG